MPLQFSDFFRGPLQVSKSKFELLPSLLLFVQALTQALHKDTNARKCQETQKAVGIAKDFMGVLMVGNNVHETPAYAGQNGHAHHRRPSQIPAAKGYGDEIEDEKEKLVSGQIMDVAQYEQVGEARQDHL